MPGPNFVLDKGFKAASAITQFTAVKLVTSAKEQVTAVTGLTDFAIGIAQDNVVAGDATKQVCNVRVLGISQGIAGGTITIGDSLKVNATGQLITTTTAADRVVGIALTAATAVGDWIDVMLTPGVKY